MGEGLKRARAAASATRGPKLTYRKTENGILFSGETMVLADDERIGFVRKSGDVWWATDSEFIGLRRPFKTRTNAVRALLRRAQATA